MRENRASDLVGGLLIIAQAGDRTHDLPHTVEPFKHGHGVPRPYSLGHVVVVVSYYSYSV